MSIPQGKRKGTRKKRADKRDGADKKKLAPLEKSGILFSPAKETQMTALVSIVAALASKGPEIQDAYHYALEAAGQESAFSGSAHLGQFVSGKNATRSDFFEAALRKAKEIGIKLPNARLMGAPWVASEIKRQAKEAGIDANSGDKFRPCSDCGKNVCLSWHERFASRSGLYRCEPCEEKRSISYRIDLFQQAQKKDADESLVPFKCSFSEGVEWAAHEARKVREERDCVPETKRGDLLIPDIFRGANYLVKHGVYTEAEAGEGLEEILRAYAYTK